MTSPPIARPRHPEHDDSPLPDFFQLEFGSLDAVSDVILECSSNASGLLRSLTVFPDRLEARTSGAVDRIVALAGVESWRLDALAGTVAVNVTGRTSLRIVMPSSYAAVLRQVLSRLLPVSA